MIIPRPWYIVIGVIAVVGCLAVGGYCWWSWPEPLGDPSGEEFYHHHDLGSPFATGIPYALALAAMERYPEELGKDKARFCSRFAALVDPDDPDGLPIGMVLHRERRSNTDFLMTNCAFCHTAVIEGRKITGLGNRNLRINALNQAIYSIATDSSFTAEAMVPAAEQAARRHGLAWDWRSRLVTRTAVEMLKNMSAAESAKPGGGLSKIDAGPGRNTPIEYAKSASHVLIEPPFGFVKLPAVWTYGTRSTFGYDGSLHGDRAMTLSAVEFNKGMSPEDILSRRPWWESIREYLQHLKPPAYPGKVDRHFADRGRVLFRERCARCHGHYDANGKVDYEERVVPLEEIRTDPDRQRSVTNELVAARATGKLFSIVHLEAEDGYVPPPLTGIWCRGPYLHNGSVPTLADLLRPDAERPRLFYVGADTGYDLQRMGLAYEEEGTPEGQRRGKRASADQFPFDTSGPGNGNLGHSYGTNLSAEDRAALLEYLKLL